jgi:hypothetical protein
MPSQLDLLGDRDQVAGHSVWTRLDPSARREVTELIADLVIAVMRLSPRTEESTNGSCEDTTHTCQP